MNAVRQPLAFICAISVACMAAGCITLHEEVAWVGENQLEYYRQAAHSVRFESAEATSAGAPRLSPTTRGLRPPRPEELWDLSLQTAVCMGLQNSTIVRQNAQFLTPNNSLMSNPDFAPSIFDVAIQDNGVLFGNRGVPAALSDYDPRVTSTFSVGRDERVQNNQFLSGGLTPGSVLTTDSGKFDIRLDQPLMTGGTFSVVHNWDYNSNNSGSNLFTSAYTGALGVELRQPLWAGAGPEVNAIAGHNTQRSRGISGVNQGVVIAQINTRISQIDFERQLIELVRDIGQQYWDLYAAYRDYESEVAVRDRAKQTFDEVRSKFARGLPGGGAADEAQAEELALDSEGRVESALANLYSVEGRLRRLIGLPAEDDRILRPTDAPDAESPPVDRIGLLQTAYMNRLELRRQKSQIESLSLQVDAAYNLANPRLDLVAGSQLNGFGNDLYNQRTNDDTTFYGYNSAYSTLMRGQQVSWNMGVEFSVPLFLRAERAQIRQTELKLVKARRALEQQEVEVSHELHASLQAMERWSKQMGIQAKRLEASKRRVLAASADYEAGRTSLDLLLRSQQSLAIAETARHRALAEHSKALLDLKYRAGDLLQSHFVQVNSPAAPAVQEPSLNTRPNPPGPLLVPPGSVELMPEIPVTNG
jgi:outer membrane protein TolC